MRSRTGTRSWVVLWRAPAGQSPAGLQFVPECGQIWQSSTRRPSSERHRCRHRGYEPLSSQPFMPLTRIVDFRNFQRKGAASDMEPGQAKVRVAMCLIVGLCIFGEEWGGHNRGTLLAFFALYSAFSAIQLAWVLAKPGVFRHRRVLGIIVDQLSICAILGLVGEAAANWHPLLCWTAVGNGARFGKRYMFLACIVGTAGLIAVMLNSPYWQESWRVGLGALIGLNAIPLYVAALISRIEESNRLLEQLAWYDPLTGIPNRRLLMDRLPIEIARAERKERHLAVMFIDLDGFKAINDTCGHEVGDLVLKGVAKTLAGLLRVEDTLARLGGDEFALVAEIRNVPEDAGLLAEKVISAIRAIDVPQTVGKRVSASIGIAIHDPDNDPVDAQAMLDEADRAMYEAKRGGKCGYRFARPFRAGECDHSPAPIRRDLEIAS